MIILRSNRETIHQEAAVDKTGNNGSESYRRPPAGAAAAPSPPPPPLPPGGGRRGDIIYGAEAIAAYLFNDNSRRTRRRVYNLWTHFRDRKEKAGFFKLKGALCLSVSEWNGYRGS
jgi:hypothetical protein